MPIRFAWPGAACRLVTCLIVIGAAGLTAPSSGQSVSTIGGGSFASANIALDQVEAALARGDLSAQRLAELRATLASAREALRVQLAELEPRLAEADARFKQLGPAPPRDAPAETPALAADRERLTQGLGELDAAVKQARLLVVRADQLAERVTDRRHALYTSQVFERSASVLDPFFWSDAAAALPDELRQLGAVMQGWAAAAGAKGWPAIGLALVCLGALFFAATMLRRSWRRRTALAPAPQSRWAKACFGLWVFVSVTLFTPLVTIIAAELLALFGLWTPQIENLAPGLVVGIMVAAFGRGVARGLLAPGEPQRRLIALDAGAARCLYEHVVWSARVFGATIFLQAIHKTLAAPHVLVVATNMLFALAIGGVLVHLVLCLRNDDAAHHPDAPSLPGVRLLAWLVLAVIAAALLAGYAGLAAFVALRTVVAVALICALYLLLVAADALFTDGLNADTPRGRAVAANLGVAPRNIGILGTLLSAAVRVVFVLFALVLIVGPWEASTADLLESMQAIPLGFRLGDISISFRGLLAALTILLLVLLFTRIAQGWLQRRFLPLTTIEPSLQLSIVTISGYVGVITAVALALGGLGIDLQKIALVAGALSVGIGFGLQSIVSNFVSGLILLAERPIRVGDSIVVKGEEGWVRRIRVRATEIETFERATVIVPNSELITGVVKNWTHSNTLGRVIVKIGVGYDSDPEQVRDLLVSIALEHPQIVQTPPPRAFLIAFGDSSLDFELRCVVADVDNGLAVKSDLHFAVLKRCREAGIEIPYPQREIRIRRDDNERSETAASAAIIPAPNP